LTYLVIFTPRFKNWNWQNRGKLPTLHTDRPMPFKASSQALKACEVKGPETRINE